VLRKVRGALDAGRRQPGQTILDSSSGNAGIVYAMVGRIIGVPAEIVIPDTPSPGWAGESQGDFGDRYMRATALSHEVERSFSVLIFSGVLDRFPALQVVSAQNNCGWLPYYLQRMDRTFERGRPDSQDLVARDFREASPDDRFKITRGNVARLYGLEL
jgi:hypothetical protein